MDPRTVAQLTKQLTGGVSRRTVLRRLGGGVGLGVALGPQLVRVQATPAAQAPIPTAWADAWTAHDSTQLAALFTADAIYEDLAFGLLSHGPAGVKGQADGFIQAAPDLIVALTAGFQTADWAAAEWLFSGTDRGLFPGRPASGKRFAVRGATIFALRGGKIQRDSDYYNLVTLLQQLGVIPAMGTPPS